MIKDFIGVIVELWNFVFSKPNSVKLLTANKNVETKLLQQTNPKANISLGVLNVRNAYVLASKTVCYSQEPPAFDTKLAEFDYGTAVSVLEVVDGYARISYQNTTGFIKVEDLTDEVGLVLPNLKPAYVYGCNNEETIKLRKYIKDETLAGALNLSLQPLELVIYLLTLNKIRVNWPLTKPRQIGTINSLLKGKAGVVMSIEPKTTALIEYIDENNNGVLGFVSEVNPDLTITVMSVGRVQNGEYRIEKFTHNGWKEWRPVFILFN